jgi:hypothetical protein
VAAGAPVRATGATSGSRVAIAVVVAVLAILAAAAPATAVSRSDVDKLLSSPCPGRSPADPVSGSLIEAARRNVFNVKSRYVRLVPPIAWFADPFDSDPYRQNLHALAWIDPLLWIYEDPKGRESRGQRIDALRRALAIALDWRRALPRPNGFHFAWERLRASHRISRIGAITRFAACEGVLGRGQADKLLESVEVHIAYLRRELTGRAFDSHTFGAHFGLATSAFYFPYLAGAREARRQALAGFERGFSQVVDRVTGVTRSAVPGYQERVARSGERFVSFVKRPPAWATDLVRKMRRVAPWFVMPDGTVVPFGDTPYEGHFSPGSTRDAAGLPAGIAPMRRTGYGIVRDSGSYFGTTASLYLPGHRVDNELTFDLFEKGRRVIVDSGRRNLNQGDGAQQRAMIAYSKSAFSASTLIVDGRTFPTPRHHYGSAIDAVGASDGPRRQRWYAVLGHNPTVAPQGVGHSRLYLYRPRKALIIIDSVRAGRRHVYGRQFQIAPGIRAIRDGAVTHLRADGFRGTIWNAPHATARETRLHHDERNPYRGVYIPNGYGPPKPRYALELRNEGGSATLLSTIGIASSSPVIAQRTARGLMVWLPGKKLPRLIRVARSGQTLDVSVKAP